MPQVARWSQAGAFFRQCAVLAAALILLSGNTPAVALDDPSGVLDNARYKKRERNVTGDISGRMTTIIHERVIIHSLAGIESFKRISFPIYAQFQQTSVLAAWKESPDGSRSPATAETRQHWAAGSPGALTITFERLRPGDIVDYRVMISQDPIVPGHFWNVFIPSATEPVDHAEFTVELPAAVPLHFRMSILTGSPSVTTHDGRTRYNFSFHDVAPERDNSVSSGKVLVTTAASWDPVAAWARKAYLGRVSPGAEVNSKVKALVSSLTNDEEKIKILAGFVGATVAYGKSSPARSLFEPFPAEDVLRTGRGDCKDMTVLLVGMLREAGILAFPALARRDPERPLTEEQPSPYYFDHAVVVLPDGKGEYRWLDPTAMERVPTAPPPDCVALVLKDTGYDLRTYSDRLPHH